MPALLALASGFYQVEGIFLEPEHLCCFIRSEEVFISLEAFLKRKFFIVFHLLFIASNVVER